MRKTLLIIFTLIGIISFGQELTCKDFKIGTFNVEVLEPVKIEWRIIREGNQQTELITEIPEEYKDLGYPTDPHYANIKWLDDCTYILTYDGFKAELTESQKFINNAGGVMTELIKIEGKCFYYKSTMIVDEGDYVIEGKLCKK